MKSDLCKAFCDDIIVTEVPIGLAVSTAFRKVDGDAVIFYVVADPAAKNMARLEDDGQTIAYLDAAGVDFATQTRKKALDALLLEAGAEFDAVECLIQTPYTPVADIPKIAFRFVALLLRLQDFLLLAQEHVASTFREDAINRIRTLIGTRADIFEDEPVSPNLAEFIPDLVIRAPNRNPVAVFFGQSVPRVQEAIMLQMAAQYEAREDVAVVALLEAENSIPRDLRRRASNRLAAVPIYAGDESASIKRIGWEAMGRETTWH